MEHQTIKQPSSFHIQPTFIFHKSSSPSNPTITFKMHYIALASALLTTSTISLAAPLTKADWSPVPEWQDWRKAPKSPFHFTSTYLVTATPDQVINSTGTPTPGQPGAIGYYNYGINSDLDVICYVCVSAFISSPIILNLNDRTSPLWA
jgi:hypothetical protein